MVPDLTAGAIERIFNGEDVPKAVLQLLGHKQVAGSGVDRHRLLLSDGGNLTPLAMIVTQLNHMIESKELDKYAIIQVDKYVCNQAAADKKILFLHAVTVLAPGQEVNRKIGNPVNMNATPSSNAAEPKSTSNVSESKSNSGNQSAVTNGNRNTYSGNAYNNPYSSESADLSNVHPINSLTPYQNKWTIRARVTSKSNIRTWSNSRGEGKLFSVNLLDESGEIKATGFNDSVDKFYNLLEQNKVYYFSKASLKTAKKEYSNLKNDYEMSFNNDTTIVPCDNGVSSIPMLQFDFVPISNIEKVEKDSYVDVIGVCKVAGDATTIVTRTTNKELVKRELRIVDDHNVEVSLTIWGDDATKFDGSNNPVVAVKGARVSDFSGRSLSLLTSSVMQINPDIPEAHKLKGWFDKVGRTSESQSISTRGAPGGSMGGNWKTFAQVGAEKLGMGDKPDYFTSKATVVLIRKENCMYMACPGQDCNKKVVDQNNGMYRCEKCNKEYPEFKWRLLLSVSLADFTENMWVTCFQEVGESILGVTSQELGHYKENDEDKFNEVMSEANFKSFIFKLRIKMEVFNEESRLKSTVVSVSPCDPVVYGRKLLADIKQIQQSL